MLTRMVTVVTAAAALAACSTAPAEDTQPSALLYEFDIEVQQHDPDRYGPWIDLAPAVDVNGDGRDDLLVTHLWRFKKGGYDWLWLGWVSVQSGAEGTELLRIVGEPEQYFWPHSAAGVGDLNDDGHADLIVGFVREGWPRGGEVRVLSGRDGSLIHELDGKDASYYLRAGLHGRAH